MDDPAGRPTRGNRRTIVAMTACFLGSFASLFVLWGAAEAGDLAALVFGIGVCVTGIAAGGLYLGRGTDHWGVLLVVPLPMPIIVLIANAESTAYPLDPDPVTNALLVGGVVVFAYVYQLIPLGIGFGLGRLTRPPRVPAAAHDSRGAPAPLPAVSPPPARAHAWLAGAAIAVAAIPAFFIVYLGGLIALDWMLDPDTTGVPSAPGNVWLVASIGVTALSLRWVHGAIRRVIVRIDDAIEGRRTLADRGAEGSAAAAGQATSGPGDVEVPASLGRSHGPDPDLVAEAKRWREMQRGAAKPAGRS